MYQRYNNNSRIVLDTSSRNTYFIGLIEWLSFFYSHSCIHSPLYVYLCSVAVLLSSCFYVKLQCHFPQPALGYVSLEVPFCIPAPPQPL